MWKLSSDQDESNEFLFISFSPNDESQALKLNEILKDNKYNTNFNNKNRASKEIELEIYNSKLFICCISESYLKSLECNSEIKFANSFDKPIISLIIENIENIEQSSIYTLLR